MRSHIEKLLRKKQLSIGVSLAVSAMLNCTVAVAEDKVFAFYADEHNTTPVTPTGNRTLSFDLERMELIQALDVPGILNHHADNSYNSKIYSVPKGSGYLNVVNLSKNSTGIPEMEITKQVDLIHKPRSGDAYNQKYGIILMTATNRPMGTFVDVKTDEILGVIGENVDCTLTTGGKLLSQPNPNSVENATAYHCQHTDFGGNQISGHPYFLTVDYAAIVDRTNRQISTYRIWKEGNEIKSELVNHLPTRSSIHQIVPRDRSSLPESEQADFYAIEEGSPAQGIPPSLLKMKLTTDGLILEKRVDLGRTKRLISSKFIDFNKKLTSKCDEIEHNKYLSPQLRNFYYRYTLKKYGLSYTSDESEYIERPMACLDPATQGAHNADFAPDNKHLYVGSAEGSMFIVDVDQMKVLHNVDTGSGYGNGAGSGHTTFAPGRGIAIVTNHTASYLTAIDINTKKKIKDIPLPFQRENIFNAVVSHSAYIDDDEQYYYNTWTDGGVFFRVNLDTLEVDYNVYVGGIPIQGNFISQDVINDQSSVIPFVVENDTAHSQGETVTIDVLANDTGEGLAIDYIDPATNGSVQIIEGAVAYTPNSSFSGTESMSYTVVDVHGAKKRGLITITVESSAAVVPVEAWSDTASTNGDPVDIDVLANDKGTGLSFGTIYNGYYGAVTNNNGILQYAPIGGYVGEDFFWYEIKDVTGQSAWGKVTINISNGAFVINDEMIKSDGSPVSIDVLANDVGDGLYFGTIYNGYYGTVTADGDELTYTPQTGFSGSDYFFYEVFDSAGRSDWGEVTVTVNHDG